MLEGTIFDTRTVLFSMVTRKTGISQQPGELAHYKKATDFRIDYGFECHLRVCPECRRQLTEALQETVRRINSGVFD